MYNTTSLIIKIKIIIVVSTWPQTGTTHRIASHRRPVDWITYQNGSVLQY